MLIRWFGRAVGARRSPPSTRRFIKQEVTAPWGNPGAVEDQLRRQFDYHWRAGGLLESLSTYTGLIRWRRTANDTEAEPHLPSIRLRKKMFTVLCQLSTLFLRY
jgi:hypothetical protein